MPNSENINKTADLKSLEAGLDSLQLESQKQSKPNIFKRVLPPFLALALVLGMWELAFQLKLQPDWILPSPQMVLDALKLQADNGIVIESFFNSLRRGITGFIVAVILGTIIGLIVSRSKLVKNTLGPVLSGLQQMPSVAWVPAAIIWFGLTNTTIYVVVLLGAVPSIANGLVAGINQIPPLYLKVGKVIGARGFQTIRHILMPAALPGYVAGLEQGWAFAWRSLMAAELIAISPQLGAGLGQLLEMGRVLGDMSLVIGAIILIFIAGVLIERIGFAPVRAHILRNRGLG